MEKLCEHGCDAPELLGASQNDFGRAQNDFRPFGSRDGMVCVCLAVHAVGIVDINYT